jgi:hypothetical protein
MPLIPLAIAAAVGAGAGFWAAGGADDLSKLAKWSAIALGAYVAGRALRVI